MVHLPHLLHRHFPSILLLYSSSKTTNTKYLYSQSPSQVFKGDQSSRPRIVISHLLLWPSITHTNIRNGRPPHHHLPPSGLLHTPCHPLPFPPPHLCNRRTHFQARGSHVIHSTAHSPRENLHHQRTFPIPRGSNKDFPHLPLVARYTD